ncbi:hypothetical protein LJC42_04495 [Eubacteriales bacterium OttesenSCG-928-K08]|nr:hypothetical protein [Eubacteriales bacterium OttesenSCG-928-K08]
MEERNDLEFEQKQDTLFEESEFGLEESDIQLTDEETSGEDLVSDQELLEAELAAINAAKEEEPEKPKPPQAKEPVIMACALVLLFGFFNLGTGIGSMLGGAGGNLGLVALMGVLVLIGALQIVCGVQGIRSTKNLALRQGCRRLGLYMLLACAAYVVVSAIMRGFEWSTAGSLFVAVMYLTVVR